MTSPINAGEVSAVEALRLYEAGTSLCCPACGALLETIPKGIAPGQRISGLLCPIDHKHFLVYGEDASAVKSMRSFMKELASRSK